MPETPLTASQANRINNSMPILKTLKAGTRTRELETLFDTTAEATATRVCTSADYGTLILLSYAGAVAITLPANGADAGSYIDFLVIGSDSCAPTISAATANTLIAPNDATASSVTYASTHRIGAYCRFISTGTYWTVVNLGSTTMSAT